MEDKIYGVLKGYVNRRYVPLDDFEVRGLAKELNKHFHELYWQQELEYLKEDVDDYVDRNKEYKLTEEQKYAVADRIRNSEWYCCIDADDMDYYVKDIIERSKNENN